VHQTLIREHEYAFNLCNFFGFEFSGNVKITQEKIPSYKIKSCDGFNEFYPVITINEFTQERKRFSILIGDKYSNEINEETKFTLYIWSKELSSIIETVKLEIVLKEKLKEISLKLKEKGLKIMYYCKKDLTFHEKTNFLLQKNTIVSGLNNNPADLDALYKEIEKNAEFLIGASLDCPIKPYVFDSIKTFQEGQMKLFLISGDSEDETMSVAYKSKLIEKTSSLKKLVADNNETLFVMMKYIFNTFRKEMNDNDILLYNKHIERKNSHKKPMFDFQNKSKFTLITNGKTLELIFQNRYLSNHFKFLLLMSSQFIGFEMTQFINKEFMLMVKGMVGSVTNETVMMVGNGYGDMALMQIADISIEITDNKSKIFISDITMTNFKNLTNIVFVWSKINLENVQKKIYYLFYAFCLLTYLRFLASFMCFFSHGEIIPGLFFFMVFKNFLIWFALDQFIMGNHVKIALLKRFPILYRQKDWKNHFQIKGLLNEVLLESFLLAFTIFCFTGSLGIDLQGRKIINITEYQGEIYPIVTIFLFIKVNDCEI